VADWWETAYSKLGAYRLWLFFREDFVSEGGPLGVTFPTAVKVVTNSDYYFGVPFAAAFS
jgi:hypothetical protein